MNERKAPPELLTPLWQLELDRLRDENKELRCELFILSQALGFDFEKASATISALKANVERVNAQIQQYSIKLARLQKRRQKINSLLAVTDFKPYYERKLAFVRAELETTKTELNTSRAACAQQHQIREQLCFQIDGLKHANAALVEKCYCCDELAYIAAQIVFYRAELRRAVRCLFSLEKSHDNALYYEFEQALELIDDPESFVAALDALDDSALGKLIELSEADARQWQTALERLCGHRTLEWWRTSIFSMCECGCEEDSK